MSCYWGVTLPRSTSKPSGMQQPLWLLITLPLGQNRCHFADNTYKFVFLYEDCCILTKISIKFVPRCPINKPALVQIMAWRQTGCKLLSATIMFYFIHAYILDGFLCHVRPILKISWKFIVPFFQQRWKHNLHQSAEVMKNLWCSGPQLCICRLYIKILKKNRKRNVVKHGQNFILYKYCMSKHACIYNELLPVGTKTGIYTITQISNYTITQIIVKQLFSKKQDYNRNIAQQNV